MKVPSRPYDNAPMGQSAVDLGFVTAPSGVLVLGMGGWIDVWQETGRPLSGRAAHGSTGRSTPSR